MRRLTVQTLLLYLLLITRGCCDFQDTIKELNTEFALNFYHTFAGLEGYHNVIVSPASVTVALGLLQFGAKGNTFTQLENALGYNVHDLRVQRFLRKMYEDLTNSSHSPVVQLACGLFVESSVQLSPHFSERTAVWGNGSLQRANFSNPNETATLINNWVSAKSGGEIRDFMACPMATPPLTQIAVASAMYFKSTWQKPFLLSETQHLSFTKADGTVVKVPMMYQTAEVNYGQIKTATNQRFTVLELSYLGHAVSMFIIIPSERRMPLSALEPHITSRSLSMWTNNMRRIKMDVFLPKFKVQNKFNLKMVLGALGMTDLFSPGEADFRGISEQDKLYVSEAIHEAKIEVTENGTKAAAATAMVLLKRSRSLVFKADRPFFFLLRHTNTGAILFMGRIMDPLE
ncbi:probable serpin E3 [Callorhinchus milii]|uniref:Serpin peptidase inhibitor, clade E (nexin, plasminogen activator inhibitor type 1), member 3 n=1 Tax=Callorhinchus milii TaxID=7868 RepID=A0A4W3HC03_CALMI|nr:probable serpin E3 [Callorhinchus milii]|eukprot:gi/632977506/ref/XP_007905384.1/ PREDICTED: serpin E3 [Callorhinchus milii]